MPFILFLEYGCHCFPEALFMARVTAGSGVSRSAAALPVATRWRCPWCCTSVSRGLRPLLGSSVRSGRAMASTAPTSVPPQEARAACCGQLARASRNSHSSCSVQAWSSLCPASGEIRHRLLLSGLPSVIPGPCTLSEVWQFSARGEGGEKGVQWLPRAPAPQVPSPGGSHSPPCT